MEDLHQQQHRKLFDHIFKQVQYQGMSEISVNANDQQTSKAYVMWCVLKYLGGKKLAEPNASY